MLNPYTLNIQESLKHAWHRGIGFLRCLAAKVLNELYNFHVRIHGGTGGPDPHSHHTHCNHKNIGFFSNTGPDRLKNHKATEPAFNVRWRAEDGPH